MSASSWAVRGPGRARREARHRPRKGDATRLLPSAICRRAPRRPAHERRPLHPKARRGVGPRVADTLQPKLATELRYQCEDSPSSVDQVAPARPGSDARGDFGRCRVRPKTCGAGLGRSARCAHTCTCAARSASQAAPHTPTHSQACMHPTASQGDGTPMVPTRTDLATGCARPSGACLAAPMLHVLCACPAEQQGHPKHSGWPDVRGSTCRSAPLRQYRMDHEFMRCPVARIRIMPPSSDEDFASVRRYDALSKSGACFAGACPAVSWGPKRIARWCCQNPTATP